MVLLYSSVLALQGIAVCTMVCIYKGIGLVVSQLNVWIFYVPIL